MIAPGTNALVLLIEDDETKARAAQDIILYAEKKSFQGDSADLKKVTKPKSIRRENSSVLMRTFRKSFP